MNSPDPSPRQNIDRGFYDPDGWRTYHPIDDTPEPAEPPAGPSGVSTAPGDKPVTGPDAE